MVILSCPNVCCLSIVVVTALLPRLDLKQQETLKYHTYAYTRTLSVFKVATRLIVYHFVCAVPAIMFLYHVRFLVLAVEKTVLNVQTGFLRDRPEIVQECY